MATETLDELRYKMPHSVADSHPLLESQKARRCGKNLHEFLYRVELIVLLWFASGRRELWVFSPKQSVGPPGVENHGTIKEANSPTHDDTTCRRTHCTCAACSGATRCGHATWLTAYAGWRSCRDPVWTSQYYMGRRLPLLYIQPQ